MELIRYVDLETARAARGVRLVVHGLLPSPWSEAAKAIFHVKEIPVLAVRFRRDDAEVKSWTGAHNVPVVLHDDEPPRTGWGEILALAERLGGARSLLPADPATRVRMFGLAHELAGEWGLSWCGRLLMIHGGLISEGARSFPLPVAQYLRARYCYSPELISAARRRLLEVLAIFDRLRAESQAAGHRYLLGAELTALDLYLATFLTPITGASEADCPQMRPDLRPAFTYLNGEVGSALSSELAAHRALIYARHLPWPIPL